MITKQNENFKYQTKGSYTKLIKKHVVIFFVKFDPIDWILTFEVKKTLLVMGHC